MGIGAVGGATLLDPKERKAATEQTVGGFAEMMAKEMSQPTAPSKTEDSTQAAKGKEEKKAMSDADIEEFLAFAQMSPAEKIRYLILKEKGLTEEELAELPENEREKLEQEIAAAIKRKVEGAAGFEGAADAGQSGAGGSSLL